MPLLSTTGAAGARAFGLFGLFDGQAPVTPFIVATGGTVYVDPFDGDYKIHQFTSNDTFVIASAPVNPTVEVMMVGGGGGGTFGGGGGGGYIYRPSFGVSTGSFSVVVGAGGAGFPANGGNTTFSSLIALGGGSAKNSCGSGGGGVDGGGGAGLQPTSASGGYGNSGGDWTAFGYDGGGGGAGGPSYGPGPGGPGRYADIVNSAGTEETFAIGGWGVVDRVAVASPPATPNSGNGGWGGGYNNFAGFYINHGPGQAGIVRIRYKFQ